MKKLYLFCLLLNTACTICAQAPTDTLDAGLEEVVISVTRWKQKIGTTPVKVHTISAKEIALQNPQTAADLLGMSGKVFVQKSQQGGGSPMIRGFATNRLIYVVDGVRMNTAIFRGGNIQNVISLDVFATEKAEVLFGPGSVIYGSDAIGGVMSFQTLQPKFSENDKLQTSGNAALRYSTANSEKTGHIDFQFGSKKWASVTSLSYNDFGNLKMGKNGPGDYLRPIYVLPQGGGKDSVFINKNPRVQTPSGYSQYNVMQKLRYHANEKWEFDYGFHHSATSSYDRYDRHIRYRSNGQPRYGEWYYGPQRWAMNNLSATHSYPTLFFEQFTLRLAHQSFEESRISRDIQKPTREIRTEKVAAYSANLDFWKQTGERNKIFYGFEAVLNDVKSFGSDENILTKTTVPGPTRYPQSAWKSFGLYASDEFQVSEKLILSGGLRYSRFAINALFDTTFYAFPFTKANLSSGSLNGSAGLVYRTAQNLVFQLNTGTAFRAPNVDDMGKVFDSEAGKVTIPNPNLKAEYAYNFDAGIIKTFGERARIYTTFFYTNLQNALVRRNFSLNGQDSILFGGAMSRVQAIQNAAKANVYGLQIGVEIKFAKGLRLDSDFNFQKGREELDDQSVSPSRHAAPMFGATRLIYSHKKFEIQINAQYSDGVPFAKLPIEEQGKPELYAKDKNGNPYSPAWQTLNLKSTYFFAEKFSLNLGLENLTNGRYRPYSSGISAAGLNFLAGLRLRF